MSDFFLELMSEEMPASIIKQSTDNIFQILSENIKKNNLKYYNAECFYTPNRLVFIFYKIQAINKSTIIRGPSINANEKAISGFTKSYDIDKKELVVKKINKGEYFVFEKKIGYKEIEKILIKILENNLVKIPWKKSMRWSTFSLRWLRPLKNIVCLFNKRFLKIQLMDISSNDHTYQTNPLTKKKN